MMTKRVGTFVAKIINKVFKVGVWRATLMQQACCFCMWFYGSSPNKRLG